jgi:hypothetical protein
MGKPGNKNQSSISNIYGKIPGANDISKDRFTDPEIEGLGSPYDQKSDTLTEAKQAPAPGVSTAPKLDKSPKTEKK